MCIRLLFFCMLNILWTVSASEHFYLMRAPFIDSLQPWYPIFNFSRSCICVRLAQLLGSAFLTTKFPNQSQVSHNHFHPSNPWRISRRMTDFSWQAIVTSSPLRAWSTATGPVNEYQWFVLLASSRAQRPTASSFGDCYWRIRNRIIGSTLNCIRSCEVVVDLTFSNTSHFRFAGFH